MGLETGSFVTDLVTSNPANSDQESQGAAHLRLIKTCAQGSFPDASKPVYAPKSLNKSANYNVLNADDNTIFYCDATGGAFALTLPTPTNAGWSVRVVKVDSSANAVTVTPPGTVSGQANIVLSKQWEWDRFEYTNGTFVCELGQQIATANLTVTNVPTFTGGIGSATATTQSQADGSTKVATTSYVDTGLALKAPITSPTFLVSAAAPTPSLGDNSTAIATTAFVHKDGGAFGNQYAHFQDQKAQNTNGGTFTSGSWVKRTLNTTVTNGITGLTLSVSQLSVPAGTYYVRASAPAVGGNSHQTRLQNISDSSTILTGTSELVTGGVGSRSWVQGQFTIGATKTIELDHQIGTTAATVGLGQAANFTTEVYADLEIWKIG